jgi:hypothetical protein
MTDKLLTAEEAKLIDDLRDKKRAMKTKQIKDKEGKYVWTPDPTPTELMALLPEPPMERKTKKITATKMATKSHNEGEVADAARNELDAELTSKSDAPRPTGDPVEDKANMDEWQARNRAKAAEKRGVKRPHEVIQGDRRLTTHYDARGDGYDILKGDISKLYQYVEPALLAPGDEQMSPCWICSFLPNSKYYSKMAPVLRENKKFVAASDTKKIDDIMLGASLSWTARIATIPNSRPVDRMRSIQTTAYTKFEGRYPRLADEGRMWPKDHVMLDLPFVVLLNERVKANGKFQLEPEAYYYVMRMQGHHCQYITAFHEEDALQNEPWLNELVPGLQHAAISLAKFEEHFRNPQAGPSMYAGPLRVVDVHEKPLRPIMSVPPRLYTAEEYKNHLDAIDRLAQGVVEEEVNGVKPGEVQEQPAKKKTKYDPNAQVQYPCGHYGTAKNAHRHAQCVLVK